VEDTLTITFFLSDGATPNGDRSILLPMATLMFEPQHVRFDPNLEDMGVGFLLDDPDVVAVDVAWVDDYEDSLEPVLTMTGLYFIEGTTRQLAESRAASDLKTRSVDAPYFERGVQITEWIVTYMQENVYNQDQDDDNTA
jgi:hypothetical protein